MMRKELLAGLGLAAAILAAAAVSRYAQSVDIVDAETGKRAVQVIIGLALAAYANQMPKHMGACVSSIGAAKWSQSVLRVGGWSLTLAGLSHSVLWAMVSPVEVASLTARIVVASAAGVMVVHAAWTLTKCRRGAHASPATRP